MEGTFVNIIAIIAGTSLGMLLNRRLPERYIKIFFQVIGLFTIFLGISMALETTHILHIVIALITGGIVGEYLNIQKRVEFFGDCLKKATKNIQGVRKHIRKEYYIRSNARLESS